MGNVVEVLDGLMSTGKSTEVLKWIDSNPNNRYIFVSPLLTEVEEGGRVCSSVSNVTFECPSVSEYETKSEHLLQLLKDGSNIACTHSLYLAVNDDHLKYIKELEYILIIDEEIDVISSVDGYSKDDYQWLYDNDKITVSSSDGMVSWVCAIPVGRDNKYHKFKMLCDYQALYVTKRNSNMMVTQLPIKLMTCAKRVIVLTYMFKGNILDCFLKLKGIEVVGFDDVTISKVNGDEIRSLITLLPLNKTVSDLALSSTWYSEANKAQLDTVGRYISAVGRKYCENFDDLMYTLPKSRHVSKNSSKNVIKPPKFYRKRDGGEWKYNWLPAQLRATNDYRNKKVVVHCFNRFPMVDVASYLADYECNIDTPKFSTSEMVQWIWRSQIRSKKPIVVGIANKRMYKLFSQWLKSL